MKIAIGLKLQSGPFGGGNQFGQALVRYLNQKDVEVTFDLRDKDIDIILLTDPRSHLKSNAFGPVEILTYVNSINPNVILIHRVNECDERKGTKTVNRQLALANSIMDHTVYIGTWMVDLFKNRGFKFTDRHSVILNGADQNIFRYKSHNLDNGKIKVVTHHWGASFYKGWDIYLHFDEILDAATYKKKIEFHYIGNKLTSIKTKNIILHKPCSGKKLADLLRECQIYLTASVNEPAGMHHIEGALCGLPLLYRNSGALPEYCCQYGVSFEGIDDFEFSLNKLIDSYDEYSNKMSFYNRTSENMCSRYYSLFCSLIEQKENILKNRNKNIYNPIHSLTFKFKVYYYYLINKVGIN